MRASSTQWNRPKKLDKGASTTLPARLHGRGPVPSPVVVHSYGVSDDPGGIRSSSGSAALRRAATPPWTPLLLQSSSTPTDCPTTQGGFAAHPAPLRSAGLLLPPGPPSLVGLAGDEQQFGVLEGGDLPAVLARGHPEHRLRVEARAVGDPLQLPRGVAGVPDLEVGGLSAGPDHALDPGLEEHPHR